MSKVLTLIIGLILVALPVTILIYKLNSDRQEDLISQEITKDLYFAGTVTNKKEVFSGTCLISINLSLSSHTDYDPRDTLKAYLAVIKGEKCELVGWCHPLEIGDILYYTGTNNLITVEREAEIIKQYSPKVFDHMGTYDKIEELHDL